MLESVFAVLPSTLSRLLRGLPQSVLISLEEIRIRENRPLEVVFGRHYGFVSSGGTLLEEPGQAYLPNREDCLRLLDLLTNHSMYALEEELKRGFITVYGGHRVGIAGRTVLEQGRVKQLKEIGSFNIRLAREVINAGKPLLSFIADETAQTVHHTLLISPPQHGKTTMLRDLARLVSCGHWPAGKRWGGKKVGIVDERSELAACMKGVPGFNVGPRTDVLDGCPKAEGMMMMIRSMSPDVLVVDEIGREEDATALREALHAGIRVIATAHGTDMDDIKRRPILNRLITDRLFSRYVILGNKQGAGTIVSVWDGNEQRMDFNALPMKARVPTC